MKEFAEKIIQVVSEYFNVSSDVVTAGNTNRHEIVKPKYIAIYFCRILTDLSTMYLGTIFNYKDHSGVIYAYKEVIKREKTEYEYRETLREIKAIIIRRIEFTDKEYFEVFQENDYYV